MSEDDHQSVEEPILPWLRSPPRTAASIFLSHSNKGTFLRSLELIGKQKPTRPDQSFGLSRLVEGNPVVPRGTVQVPTVHRATSIPVRLTSPPLDLSKARVNYYPRHGTPRSLLYRHPCERRAAHDGFGPEVSVFASPMSEGPQGGRATEAITDFGFHH
mmetsp:Transcript_135661/g.343341  ORF Transcript_135661/g.343341 Transcript_135661/m.343341 type:complete len:159 (+) Transcript_135661:86-562(+)